MNDKQRKSFEKFRNNLLSGIDFYKEIFLSAANAGNSLEELCAFEKQLAAIPL